MQMQISFFCKKLSTSLHDTLGSAVVDELPPKCRESVASMVQTHTPEACKQRYSAKQAASAHVLTHSMYTNSNEDICSAYTITVKPQ